MEFIPYKAHECFEHLYYQIPMELFFNKNYRDKLNSDRKILYGFLLYRLTLSAKNNWIDEIGNVFLIFTRKEVQTMLNLSDKTATKAFKQLNECKLIHEHLVKIDEEANMNVKNLIKELAKQESVNEELKTNNQLEWVQRMNSIKNRAEEIVFNELIYG